MEDYSFSSIEEQEAHFELTQDTFLRKERAKYITQQPLSGSANATPKSAGPTSDNGKRWAKCFVGF
jgi:hypothetical protein